MKQSKLESLIETIINIASGFFISLIVWQWVVAPLYNIPVNMSSNLGITGIFTLTSIIRSYYWRRFFANGVHTKVKEFLNGTTKRSKNE